MTEGTVPTFLFDAALALMHAQMDKALSAYAETLERIKHDHVQTAAQQLYIYETLIKILDHPRGGPEAVKQLLRQQIDLIRQFDQEEA